MTRAALEHVLRAAAALTDEVEFVVIGSQAILGQFPDAPETLRLSMKADLYPGHAPDKSDVDDGAIGELSPFHQTPSGLLFYTGDRFPAWKGNLMVGSIVRGRTNGATGVERVVFNDKMWETRRETFLQELKQRIRDVRQGPDGLIYLLTEEVDGTVLKLEPAD
jgi:glucose/arabinose dehydrogenase